MATFLKTTDLYIGGAHTLPGEYYTSQEIFGLEMERIFLRRWLCIGREDQIPNPGDYILQAVDKESVIVLRDKSGAVRAYHNVCRHRGTRLCEEHTGRFSETIQCPYHAWTYALDGRLIGAPSTNDLEGFDKAEWPLFPVATAVWEGFVFINLAEKPEPFEQAWAPLLGKFSRFNMPNLKVGRTIEYDVKANWKLLLQNYSECYHCGPVHPALAKITPPTSGENDLDRGSLHRRLHGHRPRRREPHDERQGVRGAGGRAARGRHEPRVLLRDLPQHAAEPASGLRDVPHAVAGGDRSHPDLLLLALPSRHAQRSDIQSG